MAYESSLSLEFSTVIFVMTGLGTNSIAPPLIALVALILNLISTIYYIAAGITVSEEL